MFGDTVETEVLHRIDDSLIRMRRLWTAHATPSGMARDSGDGVEMSTVLVADAVHRAWQDGEPISVADVADRLDVAHSTASRLVERAVISGVVTRTRDDTDHRRVTLVLTAEGDDLVRRSTQFRFGYLATLLRDWPSDDVAAFSTLLARFAASARDQPRPTGAQP
jgi:DNA-binding MarR family transcriptional regulator